MLTGTRRRLILYAALACCRICLAAESTLDNGKVRISISSEGKLTHLVNKQTGHDYVRTPGPFWKIIFRDVQFEENLVTSASQSCELRQTGPAVLETTSRKLRFQKRELAIEIVSRFQLVGDEIRAEISVHNGEPNQLVEVGFPLIGGLTSLGADPAQDVLALPIDTGGVRIEKPLLIPDLPFQSHGAYQGLDQLHREINLSYPRGGGGATMQWFEWFNADEGLYLGSHDASFQPTSLLVRRTLSPRELTLGFIKYPFLNRGEQWKSAPFVISAHSGDWHEGSRRYRAWAEQSWFRPPQSPEWARRFKGWLRLILRHQNGDILFPYEDLPRLYEETRAAGFDTIFLLGWEKGGFSRNYPNYEPDPLLGGEDALKKAISTIQARGGKVFGFVSYLTMSPQTEFYRQTGRNITVKNFWGGEHDFAEIYTGEGTWREKWMAKRPNLIACPSNALWRELMSATSERMVRMGFDTVLYDAPGFNLFCFDPSHPHSKPSQAFLSVSDHFREMRRRLQAVNPRATMAMENAIDIYNVSMDVVHSTGLAATPPYPMGFMEMYRYTFPEYRLSNRECGLDERDFKLKANYSFLYGLWFDMSIHRGRSGFSAIPEYTKYLVKLNALRDRYADVLLDGRFVDNEGFRLGNKELKAKAYRNGNKMAVVVWNPTKAEQPLAVSLDAGTVSQTATPDAQMAGQGKTIAPESVAVVLVNL